MGYSEYSHGVLGVPTWPAVSHSWSLIRRPSSSTFFTCTGGPVPQRSAPTSVPGVLGVLGVLGVPHAKPVGRGAAPPGSSAA